MTSFCRISITYFRSNIVTTSNSPGRGNKLLKPLFAGENFDFVDNILVLEKEDEGNGKVSRQRARG
jgi:hypothetical protein